MGVKRFLVAGGMASLVLMGIVLMVDDQGFAKQSGQNPTQNNGPLPGNPLPGVSPPSLPVNPPSNPPSLPKVNPPSVPQLPNGNNQTNTNTASTGSQQPTSGAGAGSTVPGTPPKINVTPMGGQQPTSGGTGGGGNDAAGGDGGTAGASDEGGAVVAGGAFASALPETGGPSVVWLLVSVLLLGYGLLMVVFVRSVRS